MFNKIKSLCKINHLEIWIIVIFFLSIVSLSLFLDNGNDYKANLITEMASIILTAGIVAIFYKQSQKKEDVKKDKNLRETIKIYFDRYRSCTEISYCIKISKAYNDIKRNEAFKMLFQKEDNEQINFETYFDSLFKLIEIIETLKPFVIDSNLSRILNNFLTENGGSKELYKTIKSLYSVDNNVLDKKKLKKENSIRMPRIQETFFNNALYNNGLFVCIDKFIPFD